MICAALIGSSVPPWALTPIRHFSADIMPFGVVTLTLPPTDAMAVAGVCSNSCAPACAATFAVPITSFSGWMCPVPVSRVPPK